MGLGEVLITSHRKTFPCHEPFTNASDLVAGSNERGNEPPDSTKSSSLSLFFFSLYSTEESKLLVVLRYENVWRIEGVAPRILKLYVR